MSDKLLLKLEAAGVVVIFGLATLLHFAYDLSSSIIVSLVAAVNESIWEHIKIFSVAYIFWAFIEFFWAKPELRRFCVAKTMGVYCQGLFIIIAYYGYTFIAGKSVLIIDLLIGFLAVVCGQLVSYRMYNGSRDIGKYFYTSLMLLFLLLMMIVCFSYFPPKAELFRDVVTGEYGVPDKNKDTGAFALDFAKNTDIF